MMKQILLVVPLMLLIGCKSSTGTQQAEENAVSLADARKDFVTKLAKQHKAGTPVPAPPASPRLFDKIQYESPAGKMYAYLSPDPKNGKKNPAIIWITGGDCNTIGDVWTAADPKNDQSARQYRKAKEDTPERIVMMYPSLRGGNNNPGVQENFYGEVDDILAAADHLAKLDYVDPHRIYLGGHSTGGTLVLLVSEMSDRFRGVFSFGPAETISNYPKQFVPAVDLSDKKEVELRAPGLWLHSIKSPTFVFEGAVDGNIDSLQTMKKKTTNAKVKFFEVKGVNHFSILAPLNTLIAKKILKDNGEETNIAFTDEELTHAVVK
ncbi:MAG: prolyl oligopeptidase family serine peptidase [Planctomycetes bacterium]|nr:prolyl oligopeptidase family serine peptidase [Planctomycetota bacterium]